ncbi:DUF4180 domain-containing protein, partial [Ruminococcaceae bacterium OttesenSCG-928-I18]|nr:DUF4180 domain-containing protein [Ruminococcaceae bacterium OttesenSCG-928-I18]
GFCVKFNCIGQGVDAIASIEGSGVLVASSQDMLELIAAAYYQHGCHCLILHKANMDERFFDLKNGLLGEALQKVINYGARLAIVGSFTSYSSNALKDFIYESNRGDRIFFLPDEETAIKTLLAANR